MRRIVVLSDKQVKRIYYRHMVEDFPDSERKPLFMIEKGLRNGTYTCLGFREGNALLGYAFFLRTGKHYLFDYLAVVPEKRNAGIGAEFLRALASHYTKVGSVLGEVEDPEYAKSQEERKVQERRYAFYLRNGYIDTGIRVYLFGVHYRIIQMKKGRKFSKEELIKIYKKHYMSFLPFYLYLPNVRVIK